MRSQEEQIAKIEELTENLSMSKYNLFKISTLIRLVKESWKNKELCETCTSNLLALDEMIDEVDKLDDIEVREPYEKKFNQMRTHFHRVHGFLPPFYFVSRWSILLLVIGAGMASMSSYIMVRVVQVDLVIGGAAIGLVIGYLIGFIKDSTWRRNQEII